MKFLIIEKVLEDARFEKVLIMCVMKSEIESMALLFWVNNRSIYQTKIILLQQRISDSVKSYEWRHVDILQLQSRLQG